MKYKSLTAEQAEEVKEELQNLIEGIKDNDQERKNEAFKKLITYEYRENGNKLIDLESFISKKINEAKTELNLSSKYFLKNIREKDKSLNLIILEEHHKGILYERIIKRFNFPEDNGNYRKSIYSTLNYIGETVKSGIKNHMRDKFNINEYEIKNVDFEEDNHYTKSTQIDYSLLKNSSIYTDPAQQVVTNETIDIIRHCISELPDKQKEAIKRYTQDYNQVEISKMMGNSQQAVSQLINKARKNLNDLLKKEGIYYLDENI